MKTYAATIFNVTAEGFSCLVFIVLIISLILGRGLRTVQGRLLLALLIVSIIGFSSDALSWLLDQVAGEPARTICVIANFLAFLTPGFMLSLYMLYMYVSIDADIKPQKYVLYANAAIGTIYIVCVIVSQFNGMFYTIDANNVYHFGPYYPLALLYPVTLCVMDLGFILHYRKTFGLKDSLILSSYAYIPLLAALGHFLAPDYMFMYIAFTLSLILVYTNYQPRQQEKVEAEMLDARTAVMLSQIKPHFLYNSLNTISHLCEENEAATQAIKSFSEYMRGNLNSLSQRELIPLEKELEHTRQYLSLEKLRFEDRLTIEYNLRAGAFRSQR